MWHQVVYMQSFPCCHAQMQKSFSLSQQNRWFLRVRRGLGEYDYGCEQYLDSSKDQEVTMIVQSVTTEDWRMPGCTQNIGAHINDLVTLLQVCPLRWKILLLQETRLSGIIHAWNRNPVFHPEISAGRILDKNRSINAVYWLSCVSGISLWETIKLKALSTTCSRRDAVWISDVVHNGCIQCSVSVIQLFWVVCGGDRLYFPK